MDEQRNAISQAAFILECADIEMLSQCRNACRKQRASCRISRACACAGAVERRRL